MRIGFIFASRNRPKKFYDCLDNIRAMSQSDNFFVWAKLDENDPCADDYRRRLIDYPELTVKWGLSESKINAINRGCEDLPECDILIIQSDDIFWEVWGFDNEIREAFKTNFPKLDGTIHYPESHALDRTIIVSILGINLYKQLGYLYHPSYISIYADNDFTEMTRLMGKYHFISKRIFEHRHPIWKLAEWNEQYKRTESPEFYEKDKQTFLKRKAENFGL